MLKNTKIINKLKRINNKKGSTIFPVIFVMAIIYILGVGLLTTSLANYQIARTRSDLKVALYGAEAGLEKVYQLMTSIVIEAKEHAYAQVAPEIISFLEREREIIREQRDLGVEYISAYIKQTDLEGELVYDRIVEAFNADTYGWLTLFRTYYTEYIEGLDLATILTDPTNFNINQIGTPTIVLLNPAQSLLFTDEVLPIRLVSTFSQGSVERSVALTFSFHKPTNVREQMLRHLEITHLGGATIWGNVLVAIDNLDIEPGSLVTVRGGLVAGIEPNSAVVVDTPVYSFLHGGLNLKGRASLHHVGDFASNRFISLRGQYNQLKSKGNIFVDTFVLQSGTVGNQVEVEGDIYFSDDIELNGQTFDVLFDGNVYGLSDGSGSVNHNESSSIVLNSTDMGEATGSKLKITGEAFLPGVTHFALGSNVLYSSAQSMTLPSNFVFYGTSYMDAHSLVFGLYGDMVLLNKTHNSLLVRSETIAHLINTNISAQHVGYPSNIIINHIRGSIGTTVGLIEGTYGAKGRVFNLLTFEQDLLDLNSIRDLHFQEVLSSFDATPITFTTDGDPIVVDDIALRSSGSTYERFVRVTNKDITLDLQAKGINTPMHLLIITSGDVTIVGGGVFRGLIIANNIILDSGGEAQIFRSDSSVLKSLIGYYESELGTLFTLTNSERFLLFDRYVPPTFLGDVDVRDCLSTFGWVIMD